MDEIKNLYDEHLKASFPDLRGEEIQGIDLVMADADTSGLIDKYVRYRGQLSADDVEILRSCYSDLDIIVRGLQGTDRQYFSSLQRIAKKVIDEIDTHKNRV